MLQVIISAADKESNPHLRRRIQSLTRGVRNASACRAIYTLTASLITNLNYEKVLDIALDMSTQAFSDGDAKKDQLVCAVYLFEENKLVVKSARRYSSTDQRIELAGVDGGIGQTISQGEPTVIEDPSSDPEIGQIPAMRGCSSSYSIPLRSGLDIYGVLLYGHPDKKFFNPNNREILDIISSQAINAMQNARLYQDLEQEKERMSEAQEEARKKLARDLHDGPTQTVSAIAMRVNFARRLMERSPQEAGKELLQIEDLARRTTKEIRHMLFTLRPLVLESQGLTAALEAMAEKMRETYSQEVIIEIDNDVITQLDMGKLGVIFYIAEEAANNARKHANAEHIWIRLNQGAPEIATLAVEDDGIGFDVESVQTSYDSRGSLGMVNLRERAELVNGVLQVSSVPNKGTKIQIWIPMTEEATERLWHGR